MNEETQATKFRQNAVCLGIPDGLRTESNTAVQAYASQQESASNHIELERVLSPHCRIIATLDHGLLIHNELEEEVDLRLGGTVFTSPYLPFAEQLPVAGCCVER